MDINEVVSQDSAPVTDQALAQGQAQAQAQAQATDAPQATDASQTIDARDTAPTESAIERLDNSMMGSAGQTQVKQEEENVDAPPIQEPLKTEDPHITISQPPPPPQTAQEPILPLKQETKGLADNTQKVDLMNTIGGSQTRRYLNEHVTPALLDGIRKIAIEQPNDPLRVLGEYLISRSESK